MDNVGIFVQAPVWSKFPMFLDFQGSTRYFLDGTFLGQQNFPGVNQAHFEDIYVVPEGVILPDDFVVIEGDLLSGDMDCLPLTDGSMLRMLNDETSLRTSVKFSGECPQIASFFDVFAVVEVNRPGLSFELSCWNFTAGAYRQVTGGAAPTIPTLVEAHMGPAYDPTDMMAKAKLVFAPINDEDPSQDGWLCMVDHFYWQGQ